MTDQPTSKKKPLYTIIFCPKLGTDQYGAEVLGAGRQIGAVWARKDPSKPPVIRYDFDIANMSQSGVTFLTPYAEKEPAAEQPSAASTASADYDPAF